ncbi:AAA family ATPase [Candidatus Babela massiliensis]|uniref:Ulp1-like desumoylating protease fused to AAA ATPase n=1 Tax=Candidatus Babela massiliensis TaxID=673862 RepID=V6DJ70_9BACT|nr:AAA family ATPase [Candidatus Babela massiliensis]CDK30968.1 Ulp1-like desumoylating protease fused to AAA ATPase [Candidatus Babela massiliensis]
MFIYNSRVKNLKTNIFFMLIVSNIYSLSMRCEKQELQSKISQYKVIQQEDGSSCGYHALYNGITIAKSLKNPSFKAFLDTNIGRSNFFGSSDSKWMKHIILSRIRLLARYYIIDTLFKSLKNIEVISQPQEHSYKLNLSNNWIKLKPLDRGLNDLESPRRDLCNLIVDVSNDLANRLIDLKEEKSLYKIKIEDMIEAFKAQYLAKKYKKINKLISRAIEHFIDLPNLYFEIVGDLLIKNNDKNEFYVVDWSNTSKRDFTKLDESHQNLTSLQNGHWLSSQEIESLIELEKEDITLSDINIFCIERDLEQLFDEDSGQEELKNLQRNFQDIDYSGTAIFLIYNSMHWVTCVVTKNSNQSANFIFADSLGRDFKSYSNLKTLIRLLINSDLLDTNQSSTEPIETYDSENVSKFSNEETQNDSTNEKEDIVDDLFLPLSLLFNKQNDEACYLGNIEILIEDLKDRKGFDKSILISGPPKTGKFSLAYAIAKLSNLPFIITDAATLVDSKMFNKKDENNSENINTSTIQPIDILLEQIKDKLPAVMFIHLLDKLLLDADSKDSKRLLINFILEKLIDYKRNNKVMFIISSYVAYDKYPENIKFIESNPIVVKFDLPDYNKRRSIILYYTVNYIKKTEDFLNRNANISNKKIFASGIKKMDISDLSSMTKGFSAYEIKEFIRKSYKAIEKGIENKSISTIYFWWKSRDLSNRIMDTLLVKYNPLAFPMAKISRGLLNNEDERVFINNLFYYWDIQRNELEEREKLRKNFEYRSMASYIKEFCKETENVQLAKDIFIYTFDSKVSQAILYMITEGALGGVAEGVKVIAKYGTKKVFERFIPAEDFKQLKDL